MDKQSNSSKTDRSLGSTKIAVAAVTGQWLMYVVLLLIFSTISAAQAQQQNVCKNALQMADQIYRAGKLDSASYLIRLCLKNKEATTIDSVEAYKLLGKIYIARDSTAQAREAFKIALKLSNCQMTLAAGQETPEVMKIFNKVKQQTCGKNKTWLWIGGGLAAGGTAAIILFSKNGDNGQPPPQDGFVQPPGRPR